MFRIHIIHPPTSFEIYTRRVESILEHMEKSVPKTQQGNVNITFLADEEIQELNRTYRGKDSLTDVLSFHYFDDFEDCGEDEVAGEIVMSESRVSEQAREHGHSKQVEYEILLIHSLLHLLGYDHETDLDFREMWKYEQPLRVEFNLV